MLQVFKFAIYWLPSPHGKHIKRDSGSCTATGFVRQKFMTDEIILSLIL